MEWVILEPLLASTNCERVLIIIAAREKSPPRLIWQR